MSPKQLKIAIVGSNGFTGRHLVSHLHQSGYNNLELYSRGVGTQNLNIFPYHQLDLRDTKSINTTFKGADLVFHLVSETIPATSWHNPLIEIEHNLIPFINLLNRCVATGVKKFVFVSSAGTIYGASSEKVNEKSYTNPFSPYGINKLTMEHYLNYYQTKHGLTFDTYRVSNVYGEGQDVSKGLGIINTFLEGIYKKNKVTIFGNGDTIRNYIYIKDLVSLMSLSANRSLTENGIFNLSSNDTLSINELVLVIQKVVGVDFDIDRIPARKSDNTIINPDNNKIMELFPKFNFTPLEKGISNTFLHICNTLK